MLIELKLAKEIIEKRLAEAQRVSGYDTSEVLIEEVKNLRVLLIKARRILLEQSVAFVTRLNK